MEVLALRFYHRPQTSTPSKHWCLCQTYPTCHKSSPVSRSEVFSYDSETKRKSWSCSKPMVTDYVWNVTGAQRFRLPLWGSTTISCIISLREYMWWKEPECQHVPLYTHSALKMRVHQPSSIVPHHLSYLLRICLPMTVSSYLKLKTCTHACGTAYWDFQGASYKQQEQCKWCKDTKRDHI